MSYKILGNKHKPYLNMLEKSITKLTIVKNII